MITDKKHSHQQIVKKKNVDLNFQNSVKKKMVFVFFSVDTFL